MSTNQFSDFSLSDALLRAVREEGYERPTPIQVQAIPHILAGRDVMAAAQTGTGKTAAFCLPMIERLGSRTGAGPRALVMAPTRELALQIRESIDAYGKYLRLSSAVVLGGAPMSRQVQALARRPDVLVATPGRLLDLVRQNQVNLGCVEIIVLDEADRMLDMGFIHDVRQVVSMLRPRRQTLLFSATLSPAVVELARGMLTRPVEVRSAPDGSVVTKVDHKVIFVDRANKRQLLVSVLEGDKVHRALVFTGTRHRADRLVRYLETAGIAAVAIHSNKSQNQRQRNLAAFHEGQVKVLVATDIVARGIDVDRITHVINYELPRDSENYVHRVGRTARASASGVAISFCDVEELPLLGSIERLIGETLPVIGNHAFHSDRVRSMHRNRPINPDHVGSRAPRRHRRARSFPVPARGA